MEEFGERIKQARCLQGLTLEGLCNKLRITRRIAKPPSASYLSQIEFGGKLPSMNIFISIIRALNLNEEECLAMYRRQYVAEQMVSWEKRYKKGIAAFDRNNNV